MNSRYKRTAAIFVAACAVAFGAACSPAGPGAQQRGTEVKVALSSDMRSSFPGVDRDSNSDDVLANVVEGLVAYRADGTVAPMAAETYSVSDDLKTYRFRLRDGLLFHNGQTVLARHVRQNWLRILDPQTRFHCLPFYDGTMGVKVIGVDAPDDKTVVIRLDRPNAVFLEMLAYIQCPVAVLHPDSWDKSGKWQQPIATGPFRLKEWKKGNYVLLEKFASYRPRSERPSGLAGAKAPLVDRVRWIVIGDTMAQKAAVVSSQIDLMYSVPPVTAVEMRRNERVRVLSSEGLSRRLLLLQTADPLLKDPRIRRGLAHALDVGRLADVTSFGLARGNPSVLSETNPNYSDGHRDWVEYDPALARTLLKEAEYKGESVTIQTTRSLPELYDIAMVAQAMLKKAGVNAKVEVLEWGSLMSNYSTGKFQILAFEFSPRVTAFLNYYAVIGQKSTFPYIWDNPQAVILLNAAVSEKAPDQQKAIYEQLHVVMKADVPAINIYYVPVIDVTSRRLRGYQPWPGQKPRMWNVQVAGNR